MSLEERVAWAINFIKNRDKLNNVQLSRKLGINKNTVGEYSNGKGDMKGCALAGIVKEFSFNGEWLISGRGEPFPGAREKFPEVCGSPGFTADQYKQMDETLYYHTKEALASYDPEKKSEQKINIDDAMGKTYKVLKAGSALSVALYMNIQQFALALDTGQVLQLCQEEIKKLQDQINDLNKKVDRLSASPGTSEGQGDVSESEKVA